MMQSPPIPAAEDHPRPQFRRSQWQSLDGAWRFAYDDAETGAAAGWFRHGNFDRTITVPFPPESPASGINDTGFHPVVWYARSFAADSAGPEDRLLLHFGAVDYQSSVWVNGSLVAEHTGGHSPFTADITDSIDRAGENLVVVRAIDRPNDVSQPRGKQDWLLEAHEIWYDRTTGIWQPVWLEVVPRTHVTELAWQPNGDLDSVRLELQLNAPLPAGSSVAVSLSFEGTVIAEADLRCSGSATPMLEIPLRDQKNTLHSHRMLWHPEHPHLIDAVITVRDGAAVDTVHSYLGLRTVGTRAGRFLLNDHPYFVRAVLEQGFWPQSHLAAPSSESLRAEVELIKSLGFNTARIHQKAEDPRFLYWADRLGLMLWGEAPAAYEFTTEAATRLTAEWIELVRRDRSHPSIVTWVPINESWGVSNIATSPAQRAFARAITDLTRALDPGRPVISNDGWEHTNSDILTVHDYDGDPATFAARYGSKEALETLFAGYGHPGRLMMAEGHADLAAAPVMVSEFGGTKFVADPSVATWGYTSVTTPEAYEAQLHGLVSALCASPVLAGFCYTQLTDTMQEANGLTDENRVPKLPVETIRAIIRNTPARA